jgi:hypothetical protein
MANGQGAWMFLIPYDNCVRRCIVIGLASCVVFTASKHALGEQEVSKDAVAAWLAHQEGLVRTAVCEFEVRASTTPPEAIPLIRQVCRNRGSEAEYVSYIIKEAIAQNEHFSYGPFQKYCDTNIDLK